jgi:8-oxo-dGTP diphosphatase
MVYRNKKANDIHEGKWNGLGGKFEAGETPEECIKREVQEEAGLVIENPRLHGVLS